MKKEDYIKLLHEDMTFSEILSKATDPKEARYIKAFAEEFMISFMEVMIPLREAYDKDPEGFKKQLEEIGGELFKNEETPKDDGTTRKE